MSEERSEYLCQAPAPAKGEASDGLRPTSSVRSADAWRPIESAPKTPYEEILVLVETYEEDALTHRIAMWDPENEDWTVFMANWDPEPRYWMPLLPPPGRQDEVAASAASDDSHHDQGQPDTIKSDALAEAVRLLTSYTEGPAAFCSRRHVEAIRFIREHGGSND